MEGSWKVAVGTLSLGTWTLRVVFGSWPCRAGLAETGSGDDLDTLSETQWTSRHT